MSNEYLCLLLLFVKFKQTIFEKCDKSHENTSLCVVPEILASWKLMKNNMY